ncbi:hypothetical protein PR048_005115 [Dryococelus australis]|uniref:Transposase n=1 Tax=Dryococelus australis TaxID=614101 RepID=A0ABQ9I7B0_9NEOP|nr:hypothetical protein PR048_005115 [Dryococelus australis]
MIKLVKAHPLLLVIYHIDLVNLPCRFVEEKGFRDLMHHLKLNYCIPKERRKIQEMLKEDVLDLHEQGSSVSLTTDNWTNNDATLRAAIERTQWSQRHCFAHALQLAMSDAKKRVSNVNQLLSKCRTIVAHYNRNSVARGRLLKVQ